MSKNKIWQIDKILWIVFGCICMYGCAEVKTYRDIGKNEMHLSQEIYFQAIRRDQIFIDDKNKFSIMSVFLNDALRQNKEIDKIDDKQYFLVEMSINDNIDQSSISMDAKLYTPDGPLKSSCIYNVNTKKNILGKCKIDNIIMDNLKIQNKYNMSYLIVFDDDVSTYRQNLRVFVNTSAKRLDKNGDRAKFNEVIFDYGYPSMKSSLEAEN